MDGDLFNQSLGTGERTFCWLLSELNELADKLTASNELPERGIVVRANIGRGKDNAGKVISHSIFINEPVYPATAEEMKDENRNHIVLLTVNECAEKAWEGYVRVSVPLFVVNECVAPNDAVVLNRTSTDLQMGNQRYNVPLNSKDLVGWLERIVQLRIDRFVTSADSFGCCSLFNQCSDAKKCIHTNRLYSTACAYRRNLESGRIFYGKNANV